MKRIILASVFVLSFCLAAFSHPPSDIIITFDLGKSAVYADIRHDSKHIDKHYIKQIIVLVNGKEMIKQQAITQTSSDGQRVMYVIPGLKAGDKVAIDADCSIYGDLTKEAVVKVAPQETRKPSSKPEANASSKFRVK
jgi:hypothetical protein